jgi:DNA modification methylase
MITTPDRIEHLAVASLVPYARNSRTHSPEQVGQIAASIREFGFTNPVLVDEHGGIIAGHGRVMAAQSIGLDRVPCIRLAHLSEAQRRAYVIADNKLALNAGWDDAVLAAELRELQGDGFDLGLTGFGDDEIAELLAAAAKVETQKDADAVPPAKPDAPVAATGDVWLLGRHRLVCGDSTDPACYQSLLKGERVDAVWTDPPYNVAYETKAGSIANDDLSDAAFRAFLDSVFRCIAGVMKPGAAIYVAHADTEGLNFRASFLSAGLKLSGCLIWRKDALVLGRSDYQWIHEPILYGWLPGKAHTWRGGRKQTTVLDSGPQSPFTRLEDGRYCITLGEQRLIVDGGATLEWIEGSILQEARPKRNDVHPTMKPVALIERMLRNSARGGAVVLDAFGGSGSTLMAAERLGMAARLLELSPIYCDVIIRRWQDYTGQPATLEGDGRTFAQIAKARGAD